MLTKLDYLTRIAALPRTPGIGAAQNLERVPQARAGPQAAPQRESRDGLLGPTLFISGKGYHTVRPELIARAMDHAETALLPWPPAAQVVQVVVSRQGQMLGKHIHAAVMEEMARWPARHKGRK
jgi:hypothetical protein